MSAYDSDDLFGSEPEDVSSTQPASDNALSIYPPVPMPMPALLPMPAALPMPSTEVSAQGSYAPRTRQGTRGGTAVPPTPDFSIEQRRALWQVLQTTRRPGSITSDPSQLLQRFIDRQTAAAAAPAADASVVTAVPNVAIPIQQHAKTNPPPPGTKISHARDKKAENRIGQYEWYDPFPVRKNWVAGDHQYAVKIRYSKKGELKPVIRFDRKALEAYIRGCAKVGIPLRVWVQNSATMHTDRFPSRASTICRAANCPVRNNMITRGMYQVCFDEYPTETTNGRFDPFYVAAYMHLFCLEEMIPMAELMACADVQPDAREFPLEQRNPMSLNRDGGGRALVRAYHEWKAQHYDRFVFNNVLMPRANAGPRRSGDCLYKHLTLKKMEIQPSTRQKMRDQRNGFDISKHCGNLRKLVMHRAETRKKRRQAALSDSSDDEQDIDSDLETLAAPPKRVRTEAAPLPAEPATPPRRSRRLFNAVATCQVETAPAPVAAPVASPVYDPYGTSFDLLTFNNYSLGGAPAALPASVPQAPHRTSQGLNVQTTVNTAAPAAGNPLHKMDLSAVPLDQASDTFWASYQEMMDHSSAVLTETGADVPAVPALAACTSPQSPYRLRDTPARRETAVRLLSARTSQIQNGISTGLIDPALLQQMSPKTNFGPANPAAPVPVQPATPATPSRRVTRSMNRHVESAETTASIDPLFGELDPADTNLDDIDFDNIDLTDFDYGACAMSSDFEVYLDSLTGRGQ